MTSLRWIRQLWTTALVIRMSSGWASAEEPALAPNGLEFFENKIRPVLVAECYECHGAEKQKGGLVLHSRDGLRKGGDSGPAIIPGNPGESLLIQSILHADPDLKMPSKAPKLEPTVIANFEAWVKMGAPDPRIEPDIKRDSDPATWAQILAARKQWWAFQPVKSTPPPVPQNAEWSDHPVDRFILHAIESQGLQPAPPADARVLIRRLSFALTGLPPNVEQTESFVAATAADREAAIASAADRLLASSAFGERWARHWMDLARYAETYGSEHDYLNPHAWRYRDYLIRAFNADLPYDRFVQEQIAGDLLEPRWNDELGINEALLGTAWHRMIESYATPVDVKREEVSVIDWQIEALGKTFLGLTIQCARCHDHKFDPISDEDFYALYGVFASTRPTLNILDPPAKLTAHDGQLAQLKDKVRPALASRWLADVQASSIESALKKDAKGGLQPVRELAETNDFGSAWKKLRDRSVQSGGLGAKKELYADLTSDLAGWRVSGPGLPAKPAVAGLLSLGSGERLVRAIQPAGFFSDAISERHGGSLRSPEFVISKRAVSVLASGAGKARLRLVIENFQNDLLLFSGVNPDLDSAAPRWVTMRIKDQWLGRRARIEVMTRDDKTCVGHTNDQEAWAKTDGRSAFGIQKVVLHDDAPPAAASPFPAVLWEREAASWPEFLEQFSTVAQAALKRWSDGKATDEDARFLQVLLDGGVLSNVRGRDDEAERLIAQFRDLEGKIPLATRAPGVIEDGYSHDSPLFPRGDHLQPGPSVARRFPEVLGGAALGGTGSGRLELARELTRRDNPLIARVMVNRIWQYLTGRGFVATSDNFGKLGEKPTHPELLDHLAHKFAENGWSVKRLIRYIVTSQSWQLSAQPSTKAAEVDPTNNFLSHARVRRLEAESIRDAMLAVAGNLSSGHAGPGIRLHYRTQIDPDKQPPKGPIDGAGRRSIYLEARRLFPSEFLAVFDAPKPNIFTGSRSETNVPAQSLTLLNDPFVLHQAGVWAKRIEAIGGSDHERITRMYQEAFARSPNPDELARLAEFVGTGREGSWRDVAHAIFNMKEFIYLQ
jgi:hypothetical protein